MSYKLPMIPGFQTCNKEIKMRYPKTPDFDIMSGVHIIRSLHVKNEKKCNSVFNSTTDLEEAKKPTWLVFDKQNLTFDAYFKSTVNESFGCTYNLRKCKIIYFLEDNTIKVVEPVVINSGLPQGCLIKRHKIPLSNNNNDYYQLLDFNVGITVEFYGKQFKIIGVDSFTRDFLKKTGVDVPENMAMPVDPYFTGREKTPKKKQPTSKVMSPAYKQTQGFEGILNFKGFWDDRYNVDGDLHILEVRYFLADDTMQIVEHNSDGGLKTFLKRQKLPKDRIYVKPPGFSEQNDLLNVLAINSMNQWYAFDPLGNLSDAQDCYYHWSNLHVGAEIDVYSRKIVLSSCDEYTKQYYSDYGLNNFPSAIDSPKVIEEKERSTVQTIPVCHDENVLNKLLSHSTMEALVFKAKILPKEPNNLNREFIVKCFLSDQSFSVSEMNIQTAGAIGCRFFSKRKIPKESPNEFNVIFKLYVGVKLIIDGFQFVFVDVEDRTLRFMMDHPKEFPHSDVHYVMNQISKIIKTDIDTLKTKYFQNRNEIERNEFIEIMLNKFPNFSRHGMFVLALQYKKHGMYKEVSDNLFRSILQDELKRELFVGFDGLEINFKQRNLDKRDGYLERSSAFKALKSAKLPFSTEIINMLLERFVHHETNKVDYVDLLEYLNYTINPTPGAQGLSKDILLYRKPNEAFIRVGEFVNDLRKLL
ncbi:EF-hand domain-containing family member C2-like [Metopolophium dirhodum]|uniref:EF-hand domain-containing family member C2-like n=1 Tax=Metopolophium dirhodum TaxID=44670 RepID=UPI00298FB54F|nr:EF-hand domain-containing family member C2-like [Metopolophium dirhodum]